MADNLDIVVDTARAQKALDALGSSSEMLIQRLNALNSNTSLDKIVAALAQIESKGAKGAGDGLDKLYKAIDSLDVSKLSAAAQQLGSMANVNLSGAASSLANMQKSVSGLNANNIGAVNTSLGQTASAANGASKGFDSFATAVRNAVGQVGGMTANAATMAGAFASAGGSVQSLVGHLQNLLGVSKTTATAMLALGAAVAFKQLAQQAAELAQAVAGPSVQIERFKSSLDSIAGAGSGAKAFEELSKITKTVGGNIGQMLDPFQKFVIAAKSAGVEMQTSINVFRGFQTGLTATGASAQQTERVFNALQQMMSKGTVQAEELKGQLGDSMAGALDIASKSMGVTTKELLKMVEGGKVLAIDLLPKMARELENTFGEMARQRMRGYTGQLDTLKNNVFLLSAAFGQGALGGAVAGLTVIMNQLNTAMQMPGMESFVRMMGDLAGGVLTAVGTALGAIVNGLSLVAGAVGGVYLGITNLAKYIASLTENVSIFGVSLNGLIGGLSGFAIQAVAAAGAAAIMVKSVQALAASSLVTTLLGWGGAVGTFAKTLFTIAPAAQAATSGMSVLGAANASLAAQAAASTGVMAKLTSGLSAIPLIGAPIVSIITGIGAAFTNLWAVMKLNPFVSIIAALGGVIAMANQFGVFDKITDSFKKASLAADAAKTSTALYTEAAERLANRAKIGAEAIYDAALKFTTYAERAERSKQAIKELEDQQKELSNATAEAGRQMKEHELREKSYQESVKASTEALKYKIDREKESRATSQELEKIANLNAQSNQLTADSHKKTADSSAKLNEALKQNTIQYDVNAASINRYNNQIKENDAAIRASESGLQSAKARQEELGIAMQRSEAEVEKQKKMFHDYGTILTESEQGLVKIIERTGKYGTEAGTLAVQLGNVLRPQGEWLKLLNGEITLNQSKIAANQELIDMLQKEKDAILAKVAAGQKLSELDDIMLKQANIGLDSIKKTQSGLIDVTLAQQALTLAREKYNGSITAAAKALADDLIAQGKSADATKIASDALKLAAEQATGAKTEVSSLSGVVESAKGVWKGFSDTIGEVWKGFVTNNQTEAVKKSMGDMATSTEKAKAGFAGIETSAAALAGSFGSLSQNVGPVKDALPSISDSFVKMKEPLVAIGPLLTPIATSFTSLGTSLPITSSAIAAMSTSVNTMIEPLSRLNEPLAKMRVAFEGMAVPLPTINDAFNGMVISFPQLAESGTKVATAFTSIGTTIDKIKELPAAVTTLTTSMTGMTTTAETLIEKTTLLVDKTKTALDAFAKSKEATDTFATNMGSARSAMDDTISKLDELIKKAQEAADAMSKVNGGGGGGGSDKITAGSQRLGGMSGASPQSTSLSVGAFAGAPKLAMGIGNTNDLVKRGGGGYPTILHPNEAVVPLPRGRGIPVDMRVSGGEELQMATASAAKTMKALGDLDVAQMVQQTNRAGYNSPLEALGGRGAVGSPSRGSKALEEPAAVESARMARNRAGVAGAVSQTVSATGGAPVSVNMTVNVKDADSFKRSQPQIQADMFRAISRQAAKDR